MQYRTLFFAAFFLLSFSSMAQKAPIKFGKVEKAEVEMTSYEPDPSAEAVILADYGISSIEYDANAGFYMVFNRHMRIKILTKEGYDWANHEVSLYRDGTSNETVQGLKGLTHNLVDGKVKSTKLNRKSMFKEKTSDNWEKAKFTMPEVKEGSVIEFSYGVRSPFFFNLQDWEFQNTIPTVWSEYITKIPEYFNYEKFTQGYHQMTIQDESQTMSSLSKAVGTSVTQFDNRWVATDVPAFRKEPYMSSSKNYISQVRFELAYIEFPRAKRQRYMGTWKDINNSYLEAQSFGDQLNNTPFLKDKVQELTAGKSTKEEQIAAIANFVRGYMSWNEYYRTKVSQDLRKVYEAKEGSSADINLLLVNMLRKAGLTADPVLLSTRNNGVIRERFPLSNQFNYVIAGVELPEGMVLLDATDDNLPHNLLPQRCINGSGWRVSKTNAGWLPIGENASMSTMASAQLELSAEGVLAGTVDMRYNGYAAYDERNSFHKEGDGYQEKIAGRYGWQIAKGEVNKIENLSEPVAAHYELETMSGLEQLGELVYINPFVSGRVEENPFKLDERVYPVDFVSPNKTSYFMTFKIPEGYNVEGLPKSEVVQLPNNGGKYTYIVKQGDGIINLRSQLEINRAIYPSTEYDYLKAFYGKIVEKQAEQIVLKKAN